MFSGTRTQSSVDTNTKDVYNQQFKKTCIKVAFFGTYVEEQTIKKIKLIIINNYFQNICFKIRTQ